MKKVTVNLLSVSDKARSKCELYKIMTVDGHLYPPPYKYCTIDFMADIIEGSRVALETKQVVICSLPHIPGLRTENLVEFLISDFNSLNFDAFQDYVENRLYKRRQKAIKQQNLSIQAVPKFAEMFEKSMMISTHKGKSHMMLNRDKKRERERKDQQENEIKVEQLTLIESLKKEVRSLKDELQVTLLDKEEAAKNSEICGRLYECDIIDVNGNPK